MQYLWRIDRLRLMFTNQKQEKEQVELQEETVGLHIIVKADKFT